jgi:ADP-heptose:LPS heptosyltransferase
VRADNTRCSIRVLHGRTSAGLPIALRWSRGRCAIVTASDLLCSGDPASVRSEAVVQHSAAAAVIAPETTIADVVALARRAVLMISGDTGPTHIAAAVGTPLVGLYGPTRPERNGPWQAADITVSRAAICQCHHLRQCKLDTMCLLDIEADEVIRAADVRLEATSHA